MRALLFIVALILVFSLLGWITFSKAPDHSSINIQTDTIRADTKKAMQSGASLLRNAGNEVDKKVRQEEPVRSAPVEPAPTK